MAESDLILNIIEKTTGNALRDGARDLDRMADSGDKTSTSFNNLGKESGHVESEISRLKNHIRDLGTEIDRTGDKSLFRGLRADQSELRKFENLARTLSPSIAAPSLDMGALRGEAIAAAAALGVAVAPALGAVIAGAVVGTVGLGGIAGGIAAAASDPRVKAAASTFSGAMGQMFQGVGKPFVAPLVESFHTLGTEIERLNLGAALAPLAGHLDELTAGVAGFANSAMPGLTRALDAAGPAIDLLATDLPMVGRAFGDMVGDISESDGALEGLDFTLKMVAGAFDLTNDVVTGLSDTFHFFAVRGSEVTGVLEDWGGPLGGLMSQMNNFSEGLGKNFVGAWAPIPATMALTADAVNQATGAVGRSTKGLSDNAVTAALAAAKTQDLTYSFQAAAAMAGGLTTAFDRLNGTELTQREAVRNAEAAVDNLKAALDNSNGSLSIHTEKGRAAAAAVDELAKQAVIASQAVRDNGGSVEQAKTVYDRYIGTIRTLLTAAGLSKKQVDDLVASIGAMPPTKATKISTPGADTSKKAVDALVRSIDAVHNKTVYITALTQQTSLQTGKLKAFADGGWVSGPQGAPQLAIVHGGEFVVSHDMMRGRTAAPARVAAAAPGAQRVELVINTAGAQMDDLFGELVRRFVYYRGGNVQAALGS